MVKVYLTNGSFVAFEDGTLTHKIDLYGHLELRERRQGVRQGELVAVFPAHTWVYAEWERN